MKTMYLSLEPPKSKRTKTGGRVKGSKNKQTERILESWRRDRRIEKAELDRCSTYLKIRKLLDQAEIVHRDTTNELLLSLLMPPALALEIRAELMALDLRWEHAIRPVFIRPRGQ